MSNCLSGSGSRSQQSADGILVAKLLRHSRQIGAFPFNFNMVKWTKALLSETLLSAWWIISASSTCATFFFPSLAGKVRVVLAVSTLVGFAAANYRVFRKQEAAAAALQRRLAALENRASLLRITPFPSNYVLSPANDVRRGDFNGGYVELHLIIENTGRRDSTVNRYDLHITELDVTLPNVVPIENRDMIQGRHAQQGLNRQAVLSRTAMVRIPAENATNRGTLLFHVPGINLEQFAERGVHMTGAERRLGSLHCRLTVTDTTGTSASADFDIREL